MKNLFEEFNELEKLIDLNEFGGEPGFRDTPNSLAHYRGPLKTGLEIQPIPKPGRIECIVFVISERTVLAPIDGFFPQCKILTNGTQIPRMLCITNPHKCHVGKNCLETLKKRIESLRGYNQKWELFVLYWPYFDKNGKHLMGLVVRAKDFQSKLIVMNPHSLHYFIERSEKYSLEF